MENNFYWSYLINQGKAWNKHARTISIQQSEGWRVPDTNTRLHFACIELWEQLSHHNYLQPARSGPWQKTVMFLAISGQNKPLYSSRREGTSTVFFRKAKGRSGTIWGSQSSAQGNPPATCQGWCWGFPGRCRAHTHCPASAAAGLISFGETQLPSCNSTTFQAMLCTLWCKTVCQHCPQFPTQPSSYCNWKSVPVSCLSFYL